MASGEEHAKTYEVHHDADRKLRGQTPWAVAEIIDGNSSKVISRHTTLQEAVQTKAALEGSEEQ